MRIRFSERILEGEENSRKIVVGNLGEENLQGKKVYLEFEKPNGAKYLTEYLEPNEKGEIEYVLPYSLLDESGVLKCQGVIIGDGYTKKSEVEAKFVACSIKATEKVANEKGVLGLLNMLKIDGDGTQALFDDGTYKQIKMFEVKKVDKLPTEDIEKNVVYLVPIAKKGSNGYEEYIYVNGKWEIIGTTQVDLGNYYTKDQVDEKLANLQVELMKEVTYDELVALRDNGQLVAGQQYRIVDYDCTTTQQDTASAMHPFDIIVTADNENTLNENARACLSARDNNYFRQEFAEIETIVTSAKFKDGITLNDIEIFYRLSIDIGSEYEPDGLNDGKSDILVELGYATNNDGIEVPAMWKNAQEYIESGEEGTDYQDTYYYVGQDEIDGVRYDKWRKIEDSLTWEDTSQIYILTNVIVDAELEEKITKTYIENNLHTWEIKYSLDNDKSRFYWACDGLQIYTDDGCWFKNTGVIEVNGKTYYKWENFNYQFEDNACLLSETLDLKMGDQMHCLYFENNSLEEDYSYICSSISNLDYYIQKGKGVVYYMKDDKGNECGYDFKNILYYKESDDNLFYTFNKNDYTRKGTQDLSLNTNEWLVCCDNVIKPKRYDVQELNFTIFGGTEFFSNTLDYYNYNNYFDMCCYLNTIGKNFINNFVGEEVSSNHFGTSIQECEFEGYIYNQQFVNGIQGEYFSEGYENNGVDPKYESVLEKLKKIEDYNQDNSVLKSWYFQGNDLLTTFNCKNKSVPAYACQNCNNLTVVNLDNVQEVGNYAFENCPNIIDFTIDLDGTNTFYFNYMVFDWGIKNLYFYGNMTRLLDISYPAYNSHPKPMNVYYYNNTRNQFEKIVTFKNNLEYSHIPQFCFLGGMGIENFNFDEKIKTIGIDAFRQSSIKELTFTKEIKKIDEGAFYGTDINTIYYKGTIDDWYKINFVNNNSNPIKYALNMYVYDENEEFINIKNLIVPNTMTSIETNALSNNKVIETLKLSDSITNVCERAFEYCTSLKKVELSKSMVEIPKSCFNQCAIEEIEIPSNIKTIRSGAFNWPKEEIFVRIYNTLTEMEKSVFTSRSIICCEQEERPQTWDNSWCSDGAIVYWGVNNNNFIEINNNKYLVKNGEAILVLHNNKSKEIYIPNSITLNNVEYNVTTLGGNSCTQTKAKNYINPSYITKINDSCFYDNDNLISVDLSNINVIPTDAFYHCNNLENIILSENLEEICDYAFGLTKINKIELPDSLTKLGKSAFTGTSIKEINTKNVQYESSKDGSMLYGMTKLEKAICPKLKATTKDFSSSFTSLKYLEFGEIEELDWDTYYTRGLLKTLIIRNKDKVCTLKESGFYGICPNVIVYVPDALVEEYKEATNWIRFGDRIKPLSEYVEE